MYIYGYTETEMAMKIDSILSTVDTTDRSFFVAFLISYFLKIELARREEIELEYSFLTRSSRTIQNSSNVVLLCKRG